jgi:hypothetical protein
LAREVLSSSGSMTTARTSTQVLWALGSGELLTITAQPQPSSVPTTPANATELLRFRDSQRDKLSHTHALAVASERVKGTRV